jgi:hypothetical protein
MRYHTKPILIGVLSYLPIYAIFFGISQISGSWLQNQLGLLLITSYSLIMLPACGYIAAHVSRQNGLFVGATTGILIAVATVVISASFVGEQWYGESLASTALSLILKYGFYSALGGGVGELHARRN